MLATRLGEGSPFEISCDFLSDATFKRGFHELVAVAIFTCPSETIVPRSVELSYSPLRILCSTAVAEGEREGLDGHHGRKEIG